MSYGNSIYATRSLFEDPSNIIGKNAIRRIIGNLGRPGLTMLIPPAVPRIRARSDEWRHILHRHYDVGSTPEDRFPNTSLHLSITSYELPFSFGIARGIDAQCTFVEPLVSVFDKGDWVADLDVLGCLSSNLLERFGVTKCRHTVTSKRTSRAYAQLTTIDNWDELLDPPDSLGKGNSGVVRAHQNWLGRLAAACISVQKGYRTAVLEAGPVCLRCLYRGEDPVEQNLSKVSYICVL